jgi:hypothetical protein
MIWLYYNIRMAIAHARYHRYLREMTTHRECKDLVKFKQAMHRAEDAWRKVVYFTQKLK